MRGYKDYFKDKKITVIGLGLLGNQRFSDARRLAAFLHGKTTVFPTPFPDQVACVPSGR